MAHDEGDQAADDQFAEHDHSPAEEADRSGGEASNSSGGDDPSPDAERTYLTEEPPGAPGGGLRWSFELDIDLDQILDSIGATPAALDELEDLDELYGRGQEPGEQVSTADGKSPGGAEPPGGAGESSKVRDLTGAIVGQVPTGPNLVAFLSTTQPDALTDWDLPEVAAAWRRIASWAQAQELAAVAQIASRTAARDPRVGVGDDGRPARVPASAAAEVSLALTMSQYGAAWWTDLAVELQWRLAATGEALAAGTIDLPRARLIADATAPLDDDTARAVQDTVLPRAADQTTGQLRAALRRAVIAADPEGAEDRRRDAESRAKVNLHADETGTATLVGTNLPGVHAAAAMARLTALARALKASGAGGGIDLLRAQVLIGLVMRSSYGPYYGDQDGKSGTTGRDGRRGRPGGARARGAPRGGRQAHQARPGLVGRRGSGDLLPDFSCEGPGPDQRGPAGADLPAHYQAAWPGGVPA
jgi:Domain of unknown function (DUF222)